MKFCFSFLLGTNSTQAPNVTAVPPPIGGIPADIKIGITAAYAVIFVVALFGSSLGLFVVLKKSSSAKNVTNLFIANMAVADLLLALTVMPYTVAVLFRGHVWFGGTLGTITCKALSYAIPISLSATVLTMMLISFDRFYAVFYPFKEKVFRSRRSHFEPWISWKWYAHPTTRPNGLTKGMVLSFPWLETTPHCSIR